MIYKKDYALETAKSKTARRAPKVAADMVLSRQAGIEQNILASQ